MKWNSNHLMSGEHVGACFHLLIADVCLPFAPCVIQGPKEHPRVFLLARGPPAPLVLTHQCVAQNPRTFTPPPPFLPAPGIQAAFTIQVKECEVPNHSLVRQTCKKWEPSTEPIYKKGNLLLKASWLSHLLILRNGKYNISRRGEMSFPLLIQERQSWGGRGWGLPLWKTKQEQKVKQM